MTTQDSALSAALGWPGGISDPVLDRVQLLQMVAALMQDKLWEDHRVKHLWDHTQGQTNPTDPGFWGRVAARQARRIKQLEAAAQQALEALESVLCNPDGKCCIDGSNADRAVVDAAITALRAPLAQQTEPTLTIERLRDALVASRIIDPAAVEDPDGYDDGVTLHRIEALHRRLT